MNPPLDPRLVFDRFVIGPGNLLAATAARRVAESPGRSYNPLVVSGGPGVGKTHLLTAIAHLAREVDPDILVQAESAEEFVDRLTASIADGTVGEMREASATAGLWIFDDLQALAGKTRSQEELAALWESARARGTQLVVSVDRPLTELGALDRRLASRLDEGLTVDLGPPDRATRLAILRQLSAEGGHALAKEVLEALAALPIENVRELSSALERVVVHAESGGPVEASDVARVVGIEAAAETPEGEFAGFLTDISSAVAAVVETAPWRRELAEAILRWEGEGVRTRRLEAALDAESAPDVEGLLRGFARDVARLRELARTLPAAPADPALLSDPDRLDELEALAAASSRPAPAAPRPPANPAERIDPWFLNRARFAWDWVSLEERIIEEQR
jgi:hypothetical protein